LCLEFHNLAAFYFYPNLYNLSYVLFSLSCLIDKFHKHYDYFPRCLLHHRSRSRWQHITTFEVLLPSFFSLLLRFSLMVVLIRQRSFDLRRQWLMLHCSSMSTLMFCYIIGLHCSSASLLLQSSYAAIVLYLRFIC